MGQESQALRPTCNTCRQIPIIGSTEVDPEFGTGCLKITPGHDPTDYAIGLENKLEIINIMGDDGHLNANAGKYKGMERFAARQAVWKDLKVITSPALMPQVLAMLQPVAERAA